MSTTDLSFRPCLHQFSSSLQRKDLSAHHLRVQPFLYHNPLRLFPIHFVFPLARAFFHSTHCHIAYEFGLVFAIAWILSWAPAFMLNPHTSRFRFRRIILWILSRARGGSHCHWHNHIRVSFRSHVLDRVHTTQLSPAHRPFPLHPLDSREGGRGCHCTITRVQFAVGIGITGPRNLLQFMYPP
jgi:hypothetical protein